jgi:L-ascorbate metabolism protein UlaG (beta-lactamase superfamily)
LNITRENVAIGAVVALLIIVVVIDTRETQSIPMQGMVGEIEGDIVVTLLNNAGVMIEVDDKRIYIDPFDIPDTYADYPADAVLITHDHGDHYQYSTVNMLQKENTLNVFPSIMDTEIARHDGIGVVPEDEFMIGDIKVTAYYMYTFSAQGFDASHPQESQFTSYIVDIGGFTIFHGGDTKNIPEYNDITGTIDVAMLPLGPGCQSMAEEEVVAALDEIDPDYFIPLHFTSGQNDQFCSQFRNSIEALTDCEICNLDNFETHSFVG